MSFFCKKKLTWILSRRLLSRGLLCLGLFTTCAGQPKSVMPPGGAPPGTGGEHSVSSEKPAERPPGAEKAPKKAPEKTAAVPRIRPEVLSRGKKEVVPVEPERTEKLPEKIPEIPKIEDDSATPGRILGRGRTDPAVLAAFLRQSNPRVEEFADQLAQLYVEEAAVEGINHDVAFSQMLLETGFLILAAW